MQMRNGVVPWEMTVSENGTSNLNGQVIDSNGTYRSSREKENGHHYGTETGLESVLKSENGIFGRSPRSILVTGAAGFIGSHVVEGLLETFEDNGTKVYSFDCLQYCASLRNLSGVEENSRHEFIKGDVCSLDFVLFVLRTKQIDTVVHLAAQTHVDNSFGNSLDFTLTNTYGTHVLLEASKQYGRLDLFLHVSTDEVYGENLDDNSHNEHQSLLQPTNP